MFSMLIKDPEAEEDSSLSSIDVSMVRHWDYFHLARSASTFRS